MSYQSRRMNLIFTFNIIIVLVNIQTTQTRMCYVCGIGSEEPFTHNIKSKLEYPMDIPLSCNEFERSTDLEKFSFTCPSNYVGCITQTDGTDVFRTCDMLPIDDCQIANGVEYCYCNTDLCNKKRETSIKIKHETLYDDDDTSDDFESSGLSSIDKISDETIETIISINTTSSSPSSEIPIIQSPSSPSSPTIVTETTTVTTAESITANKIFTTNYSPTSASATTTSESTNATNSHFMKCSKVIFIMHILMLIFLL